MKAFIVYATHDIIDNQTVVQLFGRLENNQSFITINKFEPFFFVKKHDINKLTKSLISKTSDENLKNFEGEEVIKISFKNLTDKNLAYKNAYKKIEIYEGDVRPQYQFLIENNLQGTIEIGGEYQSSEKTDRVYHEPKLSSADFKPKVKTISIDTESDKKGNLYCIGVAGENYKKNFMITSHSIPDTVSCSSESECLEKFRQEILKIDPDIITGWNIIDFDFPLLKGLFRKHKIKFDVGRTNDEPRIRIEKNFFRASSMDIPGRQVLDGLNLIKDPIIKDSPFIRNAKFTSFTLEDVSQAVLKKGKLIKGPQRHDEIEKLYKTNTQFSLKKLVDYNLTDCELAFQILEKAKIIDLAIERSQLTGLPLDRLSASIAAFDSLYIREARKHKFVSPTSNYIEKKSRIKGGYVQSLSSGIYKNVLVLDFKSLYPSIIRTFNIDPSSYIEKKEKNAIESPNNAYFKNQEGILPIIIEKLHNAREKAKKEERALASHAIKIIMNSFFGVLASPNCRYFNLKMANAITHFGQFIIKLTAKEIEEMGFKVIYSDTDSVFVETNLEKMKANELGKEIEEKINNFYKEYVKKNYNRNSNLELEFEKQYLYLMIPQIRGKEIETAAKKRYAGLIELPNNEEKIEITGLEAIRGDWTEAAQEFQIQLLDKLFHNQPIENFIKDYIKKIKSGRLDDKLIYRKSIRKNLEEYTKTTPPHVKAARKLEKLESNVIEYYITLQGPEPLQKLKHKIDYEHYIEKQIKPIANQILALLKKDFDDVEKGSRQAKLF